MPMPWIFVQVAYVATSIDEDHIVKMKYAVLGKLYGIVVTQSPKQIHDCKVLGNVIWCTELMEKGLIIFLTPPNEVVDVKPRFALHFVFFFSVIMSANFFGSPSIVK